MTPDFNPADLAEARRLNRRLARLPRLRMQTPVGRVALNALLRLVEICPLLKKRKHGLRTELRVIEACGQSVKLRIFRPNNPVRGVVLDLHGGGWTIGNARMADGQNANLALRLNVAVVSVDYTLALAGPIEASILECAAAMSWLTACAQRDFGAAKIIIKGSSSGAHLAAWALIRLRAHDEVMNRIAGMPRSRRFTATSKGCRQRSWWWAPKTSFWKTIKGWPHGGTPPTATLTC
ncbi:alpha/beta hydrolase [Erythrobacter sp. QSSC1-22B]|uniref:alpha/beta hydrolase n=1 Tax=Erythrobacter sp. QSSC1-22B TaxID=1860125 RepID=UPI001F308D0A|nr:alpha/beta hydrolase fold domain-containing protein [Erythrobacter sp. QSSC1-22B]